MTRLGFLQGSLVALALIASSLDVRAASIPDPHIHPVTLAPIRHEPATLTVVGPDGNETVYTPDQLETLPTYSLDARTPWLDAPARFEGILLADLLERSGLTGHTVEVVAENDFSVRFPPEVVATGAFLVATRVDGKAHTRRARGPIQFVVPDEVLARGGVVAERHLVWMAAKIRPVD
jgi:hypothetical protein